MTRLLLALLVVAACAPETRGPSIDVDRALAHVDALAGLGPRPGDSQTSLAAATYIETHVGSIERMAVGEVDLPAIEVLGTLHRPARRELSKDPNLLVRFGPPGKALLIMAHYDTVEGSPGAIDNAAAVGVLIELATMLAKEPPAQPVILAFTANEEIGLVGAEALAERRGDQIEVAIALDLIGGTGELVLNGASKLIGYQEMRWIARAADRGGVVVRGPLAHRVVSRWWPQAERSDHGPFTRRGIRAFHFYHRGHDGERIDLAYHSSRDTPARVDREAVDELARMLRGLIAEPIPAHDGDALWVPVAVNTVMPRWVLIASCFAFAAGACGLLATTRRRNRGGKLKLLVAIACFAVAVTLMIAIERALAGSHPAPWMHAPLRWLFAELAILAGVIGLASRLLARFAPWGGERRYLAVAVIAGLAIGLAWLAAGAAELAWIWLVPAFFAALAPRLGRAGWLALVPLALPLALLLGPHQIREAAWNRFMPAELPLGVWVALLSFPSFAGLAWYLRARDRSGPLGTFILPVGCLLAMIAGTVLVGSASPPCTAAQFHGFHLACEVPAGVR
jgi:hypothetical protein